MNYPLLAPTTRRARLRRPLCNGRHPTSQLCFISPKWLDTTRRSAGRDLANPRGRTGDISIISRCSGSSCLLACNPACRGMLHVFAAAGMRRVDSDAAPARQRGDAACCRTRGNGYSQRGFLMAAFNVMGATNEISEEERGADEANEREEGESGPSVRQSRDFVFGKPPRDISHP